MGNTVMIKEKFELAKLPDIITKQFEECIETGIYDDAFELYLKSIEDGMMPELCEWILKFQGKCKRLNLNANRITSKGAEILFNILREQESVISSICLTNNQLSDSCMHALGRYIKENKFIEEINVGVNSLNDKTHPRITDLSNSALVKLVEGSRIQDMGIEFTGIKSRNLLAQPLARNVLKFGGNRLKLIGIGVTKDDIKGICESIDMYGCDNLNEIYLDGNTILSEGACLLFDTLLKHKSKVSKISIGKNKLNNNCINSIGEYLKENINLTYLDLSAIQINDSDIELLASYIHGNITLQNLDLSMNLRCTDASFPFLVELAKRSCIITLSLKQTRISQENQNEINRMLSIPFDEREIPLKSNTKSAAKAQII